ncbi:hypothetical protein [Sphingomonas sp.]|nr:hypothetical protein [Sphingomonas sp.]
MTEDEAAARLGIALNQLRALTATFNPEELMGNESKLTAIDLNVILYA